MYTLRQYLIALEDTRGLTRTLGDVDLCRDAQGRPCYTAGNSAVVFRIRREGVVGTLRCYTRPMRHLAAIYGERLLRNELFLHTSPSAGEWVDVVAGDWIEGITLTEAIATAAANRDIPRFQNLSEAFDTLAAQLVTDDRAHGDLKPDNLIVDPEGGLHPIDLDASFLPEFAGTASPELGTAAFQHPARTAVDFDVSLDDFPAALISTALHALVLDPTLLDRYDHTDGLLFTPRLRGADPALHEVLALFERAGHAAQYRIARLLLSPTLRLCGLGELLTWITQPPAAPEQTPELFATDGLWGFRTPEHVVVPPLYHCAFDFTERLAAVQLGSTWHFIDTAGRTRLSFPGCEAVKPFRDGFATLLRDERRLRTDHSGGIFDN